MKMLDELLNRYAEQFDDNFPIFAVRGMDEDESSRWIERSVEKHERKKIRFDTKYVEVRVCIY